MRITDRKLRAIINEELVRTTLTEAAVESGKTTAQWLKDTGLQAKGAGYTARYKDNPYYVLDNAARGPGNWTGRKFGDPFTYDDMGGDKIKVVSGPVQKSIGAIISKSGYGGGGGGATPAPAASGNCDLLSYRASITSQFARLGLAGAGLTALVEVTLVGKYVNQTGDYFIDIGNRIAQFGATINTGTGGLYDRFKATLKSTAKYAADAAMGPINEAIGAALVSFGTYMKGVQAAIAAFARGGAAECDWRAFAAACGQAWTDAYAVAKDKFNTTFDVNMISSAVSALVAAGVAALGAIAGAVASIVTAIMALVRAGAAAVGNALVAAGQSLVGAGTSIGGAAPAPMPESRRREISRAHRELNRTIYEIVKVATLREQIESLSPQATKLLLL